ncbi:MAG: glutaredoxin family protein [Chlorobiaceae bacterium]|nr:glutaredoxin family protein [Chlorobiaceae bacterium]
MRPLLTIYGKPECCLCDQAMELLEEVQKHIPFDIRKMDISGDADLLERYGLSIPVILFDGRVAFKHRIDKDRLIALLKAR